MNALDKLGLAVANAGHTWTPEMRQAYEDGIKELEHKELVSQEPTAFVSEVYQSRYTLEWNGRSLPVGTKLYAAPVRTKDLTDDEITNEWESMGRGLGKYTEFARAVIAADREKNK